MANVMRTEENMRMCTMQGAISVLTFLPNSTDFNNINDLNARLTHAQSISTVKYNEKNGHGCPICYHSFAKVEHNT